MIYEDIHYVLHYFHSYLTIIIGGRNAQKFAGLGNLYGSSSVC